MNGRGLRVTVSNCNIYPLYAELERKYHLLRDNAAVFCCRSITGATTAHRQKYGAPKEQPLLSPAATKLEEDGILPPHGGSRIATRRNLMLCEMRMTAFGNSRGPAARPQKPRFTGLVAQALFSPPHGSASFGSTTTQSGGQGQPHHQLLREPERDEIYFVTST